MGSRVASAEPTGNDTIGENAESTARIAAETDPEGQHVDHWSQSPSISSGSLIRNAEVPVPFWEEDYPSQRFRPQVHEEGPYYSPPPQMFSPPISPNEVTGQASDFPSGPSAPPQSLPTGSSSHYTYEGMKPTVLAPEYEGLRANPWQSRYMNSHGLLTDRSKFTDAANGGVHTMMAPKVSRDSSEVASFLNTGPKPALSKDNPSLGVEEDESDPSMPKTNHPQTKSFQQLAAEKTIREWNNNVLDERWLEHSELSNAGVREQRRFERNELNPKETELVSRRHKRLESFLKELDDTKIKMDSEYGSLRPDPSIWGLENTRPRQTRDFDRQEPTHELVSEPPEVQRLQNVIQDLEGGTEALPRGITHHSDVLRRHFYDRVFQGEWDGQIQGPEGDNMTKHNGRFISLKALRDQLLKDIEDLIDFLKMPVAESTRSAMYYRTPEAKAAAEDEAWGGHAGVKEPFVPHYLPGISSKGYRYAVREEKYSPPHESTPKAEGNRTDTKEPSQKKPTPRNMFSRDQGPSRPAYQPFGEQIRDIESRQPFLEQLRAIEAREDRRSEGGSLKGSLSGETGQQNKVKDTSAVLTTSKPSSFLLRTATTENPAPISIVTASWRSKGMMEPDERQSIVDDLHRQHAQRGQQNLMSQFQPQYREGYSGTVPTSVTRSSEIDPWDNPPPVSMEQALIWAAEEGPHRYQQPSGNHYGNPSGFAQSTHHGSQSMQYRFRDAPLSEGPPPPGRYVAEPLQTSNYGQQGTHRSLDQGPTPASDWPDSDWPAPNMPSSHYGQSDTHHIANQVLTPPQWKALPVQTSNYGQQGTHRSLQYGPTPSTDWPAAPMPSSRHGQQGGYGSYSQGPPTPAGPYANVATRPPSSNRIAAQVYRNDPAFHYGALPQVRGTPLSFALQGRATPAPLAFQGRATPAAYVSQGRVTPSAAAELQTRFGIVPSAKPNVPVSPYRPGSDDMRPHAIAGMHSVPYQNLARNSLPTVEEAQSPESLPFAEVAKESKSPIWGVLKIGNIPYDLTKGLVLNFLGAYAKIISSSFGPAVHIVMDRTTGKTMECYIEFMSTADARTTCNSIHVRQPSRIRIADRAVDVSMSSQDALLAALFPKAKNVEWKDGSPVIRAAEDQWSSGFKSFVTHEELGLLVKHAEQPHKSNFTLKSPQRPYEAMISLLAKYPWYSVANYNISHRNKIFNAVRQMLQILPINLRKQHQQGRIDALFSFGSPVKHGNGGRLRGNSGYGAANYGSAGAPPMLNENLLHELLGAGLNAAGFSERQRWELYDMCDYGRHRFIVSPLLQYWPFEVLGRKVRVEEDVLELYAQLIGNNPEVLYTGYPFGSLAELTRNIDYENNSMVSIGALEVQILNALLKNGIENARKELDAHQGMLALTLHGEEELHEGQHGEQFGGVKEDIPAGNA